MNKTVNINLAGIFFHIDEDAYSRLQHYLDTIKRSFSDSQGRDEIIADIEARIAELFNEKLKNERQVIRIKEVEEVIAIMGQPEDYVLDDEIFEDEPTRTESRKSQKQLFRDTDNSYIGGVSSGLGHYLNIDAIWIRILWILLTIFSSGAFILIYIALWIFVPEAKTTADKLSMRGEEVTITNIEKKIREGFDNVAEKVKDVDYQKYGNKARSGADSAAKGLADVIKFIVNVFVKLVGVLLLLVAGATLISLFIGLITVGTFGIIEAPWADYVDLATGGAPLWLISLLAFFAVGIPFFFLFILGLKILMKKVKTVGTTARLVLLGIWLLSVIGLSIFGIQQGTSRAFTEDVSSSQTLPIKQGDTLYLRMRSNNNFSGRDYRNSEFRIKYDEAGNKVIYGNNIRLLVKNTNDSVARMEIRKQADGKDYQDARERAANINFSTEFSNNTLLVDSYLTAEPQYKFRNQEVEISIFLPAGSSVFADANTSSFLGYSNYNGNILKSGDEEKYFSITQDGAECLNCPTYESSEDSWDEEPTDNWDEEDDYQRPVQDSLNESFNSTGEFIPGPAPRNRLIVNYSLGHFIKV
ncbi:PspC domain-containing protein [Salegentibacter sp. HM20]